MGVDVWAWLGGREVCHFWGSPRIIDAVALK